ncbi:MAG: hypothetical protein LBT03_00040 [Holosporales bacterium]|jgi:hypothetical protein|nr:hypothetical protein [Holosporales bacterium]
MNYRKLRIHIGNGLIIWVIALNWCNFEAAALITKNKANAEKTAAVNNAVNAEIQKAQTRENALKAQNNTLSMQANTLNVQNQKIQAQMNTLNAEKANLDTQYKSLQASKLVADNAIKERDASISRNAEETRKLNESITNLQAQISQKENEKTELSARVTQIEAEMKSFEEQANREREEIVRANESEQATLNADISSKASQLNSKTEELTKLKAETAAMEANRNNAEMAYMLSEDLLRSEVSGLKTELQNLLVRARKQITEAKEREKASEARYEAEILKLRGMIVEFQRMEAQYLNEIDHLKTMLIDKSRQMQDFVNKAKQMETRAVAKITELTQQMAAQQEEYEDRLRAYEAAEREAMLAADKLGTKLFEAKAVNKRIAEAAEAARTAVAEKTKQIEQMRQRTYVLRRQEGVLDADEVAKLFSNREVGLSGKHGSRREIMDGNKRKRYAGGELPRTSREMRRYEPTRAGTNRYNNSASKNSRRRKTQKVRAMEYEPPPDDQVYPYNYQQAYEYEMDAPQIQNDRSLGCTWSIPQAYIPGDSLLGYRVDAPQDIPTTDGSQQGLAMSTPQGGQSTGNVRRFRVTKGSHFAEGTQQAVPNAGNIQVVPTTNSSHFAVGTQQVAPIGGNMQRVPVIMGTQQVVPNAGNIQVVPTTNSSHFAVGTQQVIPVSDMQEVPDAVSTQQVMSNPNGGLQLDKPVMIRNQNANLAVQKDREDGNRAPMEYEQLVEQFRVRRNAQPQQITETEVIKQLQGAKTNLNKDDELVELAIEALVGAISKITDHDEEKVSSAMNLLGAGMELPDKLDAIVEVIREKYNPDILQKAVVELTRRYRQRSTFVEESLRHLYGNNGKKLLSWQ